MSDGRWTDDGERARDRPERGVFMISVAAELAEMHPQTLRMYEARGLITPKRSPKNTRLYSQEDVERLRRIQQMTTEEGLNLAGVETVLELEARLERMRARDGEDAQARRRDRAPDGRGARAGAHVPARRDRPLRRLRDPSQARRRPSRATASRSRSSEPAQARVDLEPSASSAPALAAGRARDRRRAVASRPSAAAQGARASSAPDELRPDPGAGPDRGSARLDLELGACAARSSRRAHRDHAVAAGDARSRRPRRRRSRSSAARRRRLAASGRGRRPPAGRGHRPRRRRRRTASPRRRPRG